MSITASKDASTVAIVTGAAGGIGGDICRRLIDEGRTVALLDMALGVHDTREELGGHFAAQLDISQPDAVRSTMAEIVAELGSVGVVVNCAGTGHRESFEDITAEQFMTDVRTNLLGTFLMSQAAVFPYMKDAGWGRLISIGSVSGKRGGIGPVHEDGSGGRSGVAYAASKAGLINMARWMAREVGKYGVTSNVITPGVIATARTEGVTYDFSEIPLGRIGRGEDVAAAVSFLAGPDSAYVNGVVIDVDGGLTRA
ncbi:SDR family NAD(P)-dependent oxidoreductase [Streptomyces sp. NPDC056296]|uniref:SDR family NAD(P)-dependent oxidoreductase n=1 Tax=Streptomyces sp. NPDC056296 TaxID=3345775 RepID=UPI0035DDAC75